MFGTRRFMDETPFLGRPVFQPLSGESRLAQGASVTPQPPPVVAKSNTGTKVLTLLAAAGVGVVTLDLLGATNLTGVRKYLMR